jgi:hypothetical protein
MDGASLEPRGCNWWQAVANRLGLKGRNQAKTVAVDCDRLAETFHGKEGVNGSSPLEGSAKAPQNGVFCIRADLHFPRSLGCGAFWKNGSFG